MAGKTIRNTHFKINFKILCFAFYVTSVSSIFCVFCIFCVFWARCISVSQKIHWVFFRSNFNLNPQKQKKVLEIPFNLPHFWLALIVGKTRKKFYIDEWREVEKKSFEARKACLSNPLQILSLILHQFFPPQQWKMIKFFSYFYTFISQSRCFFNDFKMRISGF